LDYATWRQNPQFLLDVQKTTTVTMFLNCLTKDPESLAPGFYVVKAPTNMNLCVNMKKEDILLKAPFSKGANEGKTGLKKGEREEEGRRRRKREEQRGRKRKRLNRTPKRARRRDKEEEKRLIFSSGQDFRVWTRKVQHHSLQLRCWGLLQIRDERLFVRAGRRYLLCYPCWSPHLGGKVPPPHIDVPLPSSIFPLLSSLFHFFAFSASLYRLLAF
jgi:hypothetical protein